MILSELSTQPRTVLVSTGLLDEVGPDNVFDSFDDALAHAGEVASHARGTTGTHAVGAGSSH